MNRRTFSKTVLSLSALPLASFDQVTFSRGLIRHATLLLPVAHITFLVDPMLSPKAAMEPVANAGNINRIPMVDLKMDTEVIETIVLGASAILLTHTHRDHWDATAQQLIPKSKPIFCQPTDVERIKGQGFTHVKAVDEQVIFNDVTIHRTGGQHGTGETGQRMGQVSGFVLERDKHKVYIAGDTVWCPEVEQTLKKFKPQTTIVNAGAAQFLSGGPITMTPEDVARVAATDHEMQTVAVHMDTINHCIATRSVLRDYLTKNNVKGRIDIPEDGGGF